MVTGYLLSFTGCFGQDEQYVREGDNSCCGLCALFHNVLLGKIFENFVRKVVRSICVICPERADWIAHGATHVCTFAGMLECWLGLVTGGVLGKISGKKGERLTTATQKMGLNPDYLFGDDFNVSIFLPIQ